MPKCTKFIEKMDGHILRARGVDVPPKKLMVLLLHPVPPNSRNNKLGTVNSMMRSLLLDTGMSSKHPATYYVLSFTIIMIYYFYFLLTWLSLILIVGKRLSSE